MQTIASDDDAQTEPPGITRTCTAQPPIPPFALYHMLQAGMKALVPRTRRRKEPSGNSGCCITTASAADTAAAAAALLLSEGATFTAPIITSTAGWDGVLDFIYCNARAPGCNVQLLASCIPQEHMHVSERSVLEPCVHSGMYMQPHAYARCCEQAADQGGADRACEHAQCGILMRLLLLRHTAIRMAVPAIP